MFFSLTPCFFLIYHIYHYFSIFFEIGFTSPSFPSLRTISSSFSSTLYLSLFPLFTTRRHKNGLPTLHKLSFLHAHTTFFPITSIITKDLQWLAGTSVQYFMGMDQYLSFTLLFLENLFILR